VARNSLLKTSVETESYLRSRQAAFVRIDAIRDSFAPVVRSLGGNPKKLLLAEHIDPALLDQPDGVLNYRTLISLLERTAEELNCADFGLQLARHNAEGVTVLGPLEIAMRNSTTLGDALTYCGKYVHVYTPAIHINLERDTRLARDYMLFEILLDGVPRQRQVVEHALGLTVNTAKVLSNGQARTEVWFAHGALAPQRYYTELLGVPVKFGMPYNAIYFNEGDLTRPIVNRNEQIYLMATSYIDHNFPLSTVLMTTQVRPILMRLLATNQCTQTVVAQMFGMHPRTFQRRLRDEGTTFEEIVDVVRREIALRNLADTSMSLVQITERLGYSETSVLTRSCRRWFSRSPRQMRKEVGSM
jgi:AraC-like DNA-binding protein